MKSAIILTAIASWYLVGLSVTVALVVYPSFDLVDGSSWVAYHRHHVSRITWAVGAPWAAQVLGLVWWLARDIHSLPATWWVCALSAVSSVVVTAAWAVRLHNHLHAAFDAQRARSLRRAHWLRTACWLIAAGAASVGLSST